MDLRRISAAISKQTGSLVEILDAQLTGSGYRSDGFRLTAKDGRTFFLKHVRERDCMPGGFETPERRINALLMSHRIQERANQSPRSLGIIVDSGGDSPFILPEIDENAAVYHVQEFEPEGVSYDSLLNDRANKPEIDDTDAKEIAAITTYIAGVHAVRYPDADTAKAAAVYDDGILSRIASPDLTFGFLQYFPDDDPILPTSAHGEYIGLMLKSVRTWKGRSDRLRALHGDFWSGNLFFRPDGSAWAIDYSFVPWGDPGIDMGHWIAEIMWQYYRTRNPYFKSVVDATLTAYERATGDTEIKSAMTLGYGMMGLVFAAPGLIPGNEDIEVRRAFLANTRAILEEGRFLWTD